MVVISRQQDGKPWIIENLGLVRGQLGSNGCEQPLQLCRGIKNSMMLQLFITNVVLFRADRHELKTGKLKLKLHFVTKILWVFPSINHPWKYFCVYVSGHILDDAEHIFYWSVHTMLHFLKPETAWNHVNFTVFTAEQRWSKSSFPINVSVTCCRLRGSVRPCKIIFFFKTFVAREAKKQWEMYI